MVKVLYFHNHAPRNAAFRCSCKHKCWNIQPPHFGNENQKWISNITCKTRTHEHNSKTRIQHTPIRLKVWLKPVKYGWTIHHTKEKTPIQSNRIGYTFDKRLMSANENLIGMSCTSYIQVVDINDNIPEVLWRRSCSNKYIILLKSSQNDSKTKGTQNLSIYYENSEPSYKVLTTSTYSGIRSLYMIPPGCASKTTRTPVNNTKIMNQTPLILTQESWTLSSLELRFIYFWTVNV